MKRTERRLGDAGHTAYLELVKPGEKRAKKKSAAAPPAPVPLAAPPAPAPVVSTPPAVPETPPAAPETPPTA